MSKEKLKSLLEETSSPNKEQIFQETLKIMKARGKFIFTLEKDAYFYDAKGKKIYAILDKEFFIWLSIEFGFISTERITKHVVSRLEAYAFQHGKEIQFKKFAHYDPAACILYINKLDGKMFMIDGELIKVVDSGTDDIYFQDPDYYQPIELEQAKGLSDEVLFGNINFSRDSLLSTEEQGFIYKWWFFSSFFRTIFPAKPILVLYGPPDSGKTETGRRIPKFLFGSTGNVNSPPGSAKDFQVIADKFHILILDDIDKENKKIESELVRMATGVRVDERKYYTNKAISSLDPDAFVAITTKTPHFTREDLIQRTFVLWLESKTDNISPIVLQQRILDNRHTLWSDILLELLRIVKRLKLREDWKPAVVKFRNAAWAEFVFKATDKKDHPAFKQILKKINEDQIRFLLESNPLAKALFMWLKKKDNIGRWVESGELRIDLKKIARLNHLDQTVYQNDQTYGVELKNTASTFSRIYDVEIYRPRGRNKYCFKKKK